MRVAANQRSRLRNNDIKIKFSEQSSCHSNPMNKFHVFGLWEKIHVKNVTTAEELEHKWHCFGWLFHANLHYILWFNCIIPRSTNLGSFGNCEYDGVHDVNFVFRCVHSLVFTST